MEVIQIFSVTTQYQIGGLSEGQLRLKLILAAKFELCTSHLNPPLPQPQGLAGASGDVQPILTIFYGPGVRGLHYCFISLSLEAGTYPGDLLGIHQRFCITMVIYFGTVT